MLVAVQVAVQVAVLEGQVGLEDQARQADQADQEAPADLVSGLRAPACLILCNGGRLVWCSRLYTPSMF